MVTRVIQKKKENIKQEQGDINNFGETIIVVVVNMWT